MEMRHIRYFLAVKETKSFTRAAERLNIAQPPLSMQIRDLEVEVGARLFNRSVQGTQLTEAGKVFYESVKDLPERFTQAIETAQRAEMGITGLLRLGFTGSTGINPRVPAFIQHYRERYPSVQLHISEASTEELCRALKDGHIDVAMLRTHGELQGDFTTVLLENEPLVAVFPKSHPAALHSDSLSLSTLRNDPFILSMVEQGTSLHGAIINACNSEGFIPNVIMTVPHILSILTLVASGVGVSLVPSSMKAFSLPGIAFRELKENTATVGLSISWREGEMCPTAKNFVDLLVRQPNWGNSSYD